MKNWDVQCIYSFHSCVHQNHSYRKLKISSANLQNKAMSSFLSTVSNYSKHLTEGISGPRTLYQLFGSSLVLAPHDKRTDLSLKHYKWSTCKKLSWSDFEPKRLIRDVCGKKCLDRSWKFAWKSTHRTSILSIHL